LPTTGAGTTSGCSCRIGEPRESSGALLIAGLLMAVFSLHRHRARRSR